MDKLLQSRGESKSSSHPISGQDLAATIGRSTLFRIVASLVQVGTRFLTVPIVIGYLGLEGYGVWSIIMTIAMCMRFGSTGIRSAFQKYVAEATGTGDVVKANQLLSTGSAAMLALSIIGLIPAAIFSENLARLIGIPEHLLDATAGAISLLAVIMVFSNVGASYEAIVMGGHRIDLTGKLITVFTIVEAIAIIVLLHEGYGLLAMTAVMLFSQIGYLLCCFVVSRHIWPAIQIAPKHLSRKVLPELITYAGSYQVVNILEVLYAAILPVMILKWFGGDAAGVFAVVSRLVGAALLAQEAFLLPMLSGASLIHASRSAERMLTLVTTSFKTTLMLTMLPLAFIASQGTLVILAWTGQNNPIFQDALWLMCVAAFFKSLSLLALVLYRASGRAWMDNIRQVLRIVVLSLIILFGHRFGFFGVIAGLAVAELSGWVFMFFVMTSTFHGLTGRTLLPHAVKLTATTLMVLLVGGMVANLSVPWELSERLLATFKLGVISLTTLVTACLALLFTGTLSMSEINAMLRPSSVLKMKSGQQGWFQQSSS